MFLFLIYLLHLLAMFNGYMIMSSFVLSVQTLEMLLFMYVFFKHGCNLSRMRVVYRIDLINLISGRSVLLISLNSQHYGRCTMLLFSTEPCLVFNFGP